MGDVRVGVDLVDVGGFERRFAGRDDLLATVFSAAEVAYCRAQAAPWPHLAARFAAKEAVLKALGTGLAGAMSWLDVEVTRDPAGVPAVAVGGAVAECLRREGLRAGSLSLSHTAHHAIAVVLLLPG